MNLFRFLGVRRFIWNLSFQDENIFLFLTGNVRLQCSSPWNGWIFISRSITVQLELLFWNGKLSVRDNRNIVFVNTTFHSGCDLHDENRNKNWWIYFGLARQTFITNDAFALPKWNILLCFTGNFMRQCSSLWNGWILKTRSTTEKLKLHSLNGKLSVRDSLQYCIIYRIIVQSRERFSF